MTVSAARTIVIDGNVTVAASIFPSWRWPTAEPDAVLDYSLDVSALLSDAGDTITSASIAIEPAGAGELAAATLIVAGPMITAWLGPGLAGRNYVTRIAAATSGGRTFEWFVELLIDPTPAPGLGFGVPMTWGAPLFDAAFDFSTANNSALIALF